MPIEKVIRKLSLSKLIQMENISVFVDFVIGFKTLLPDKHTHIRHTYIIKEQASIHRPFAYTYASYIRVLTCCFSI